MFQRGDSKATFHSQTLVGTSAVAHGVPTDALATLVGLPCNAPAPAIAAAAQSEGGVALLCQGAAPADIVAAATTVTSVQGSSLVLAGGDGRSLHLHRAAARRLATEDTSVTRTGIRITPRIVEGLSVAAVLLLFTCIGLSALCGLGRPDSIVQADLPVGHEK